MSTTRRTIPETDMRGISLLSEEEKLLCFSIAPEEEQLLEEEEEGAMSSLLILDRMKITEEVVECPIKAAVFVLMKISNKNLGKIEVRTCHLEEDEEVI